MPFLKTLPQSFIKKKSQILSDLSTNPDEYTDKSPKGSVDSQIIDLIDEINSYDGLVTTSSCAGRVAVFVEGERAGLAEKDAEDDDGETREQVREGGEKIKTGPGGKGGGRWLFVSHDPVKFLNEREESQPLMTLFGLSASDLSTSGSAVTEAPAPATLNGPTTNVKSPRRLIHLTFSPFILHVLCASLHHARPLLAAAINSGFRESGVQSLKGLDDTEIGAMVAVRTAGLGFETIVGVLEDEMEGEEEVPKAIVSEEYLRLCIAVINERFEWNDKRRKMFRKWLKDAIDRERIAFSDEREDKEDRKRRKRKEGLRRKQEMEEELVVKNGNDGFQKQENTDILESGLGTLELE